MDKITLYPSNWIYNVRVYDLIDITQNKVSFSMEGKKLKGNFVLVRIKGKKKERLLIKQKDQYAQSGWKLETSLTPEKRAELKERIPPCETS